MTTEQSKDEMPWPVTNMCSPLHPMREVAMVPIEEARKIIADRKKLEKAKEAARLMDIIIAKHPVPPIDEWDVDDKDIHDKFVTALKLLLEVLDE